VHDDITARVQRIALAGLESELEVQGWAVLGSLLTSPECDDFASLYAQEAGFRSHVVMARYGFGRGEYRYFSYPLPPLSSICGRRCGLFAPIANRGTSAGRWRAFLRTRGVHRALRRFRPVPTDVFAAAVRRWRLQLPHQDLYGACLPLQVAVLLSEPGVDFSGGEFVLTEQRPRMQTRAPRSCR
jgi:hypothetical protein